MNITTGDIYTPVGRVISLAGQPEYDISELRKVESAIRGKLRRIYVTNGDTIFHSVYMNVGVGDEVIPVEEFVSISEGVRSLCHLIEVKPVYVRHGDQSTAYLPIIVVYVPNSGSLIYENIMTAPLSWVKRGNPAIVRVGAISVGVVEVGVRNIEDVVMRGNVYAILRKPTPKILAKECGVNIEWVKKKASTQEATDLLSLLTT